MRLEPQQHSSSPTTLASTLTIEVEGRLIQLDADGYLIDPGDWSEALSEKMAQDDGVTLTDDHWLLIDFLHRFYREYEIAPEMPILSRNLCKDQNDCRWTHKYIKQLFPDGAKMACRYAGLPSPVGKSCLC